MGGKDEGGGGRGFLVLNINNSALVVQKIASKLAKGAQLERNRERGRESKYAL